MTNINEEGGRGFIRFHLNSTMKLDWLTHRGLGKKLENFQLHLITQTLIHQTEFDSDMSNCFIDNKAALVSVMA